MVRPFGRWMINGRIAYVVLFVVTYLLSLFFCPHLLSRSSVPCCSRRRSRPGCRRSALIALAISGQGVALEHCATHFVDGLVHAFKAMGIILPVAGFVYPGIPDYSGSILGLEDGTGPAFLFDAVESIQTRIPDNGLFAAFSMILIGMLIGLGGSAGPVCRLPVVSPLRSPRRPERTPQRLPPLRRTPRPGPAAAPASSGRR